MWHLPWYVAVADKDQIEQCEWKWHSNNSIERSHFSDGSDFLKECLAGFISTRTNREGCSSVPFDGIHDYLHLPGGMAFAYCLCEGGKTTSCRIDRYTRVQSFQNVPLYIRPGFWTILVRNHRFLGGCMKALTAKCGKLISKKGSHFQPNSRHDLIISWSAIISVSIVRVAIVTCREQWK